jgi:hypothetical protein
MIPLAILTGAAIITALAWDYRRHAARRASMHRHPSTRTLAQFHPAAADFAQWERELV